MWRFAMTARTLRLGAACVILAGALLTLAAVPAAASLTLNTIGATGTLGPHGRTATVTAIIACTAGQQVSVRVTLTQGPAIGHGVGGGDCTGEPAEYPVRVTARGATSFAPGDAQACAEAINRDRGRIVDTRQWCRAEPVQLAG
jgi:hypothetical protein